MRAGVRSAVTIGVLCAILAFGALWGWKAVTAPFPGKADAPICENQVIHKGDKVYPSEIIVSVYNAGSRFGLAGRTMQMFTDQGFQEGEIGDAPKGSKVPVVQIWTTEPHNPAVRLVESRFGPAHKVLKKKGTGSGITVVVGDGFSKLLKGPHFVVARSDSEICSPPLG